MNHSLPFIVVMLIAALAGRAQVIPVSQEPRHHVAFQNDQVRVLDVHIPPGDTSLMHKHEIPSVFIVLTKTKTGAQTVVEPAKMNLSAGNIWFEGFYTSPRIHRVWNSDTSEFHVIDMELLHKNTGPVDAPLNLPDFSILFDEKPVRGYRFTLGPRATLHIPARKATLVLVQLGEGDGPVTAGGKTFSRKGDFLFLPPATALQISSGAAAGLPFALFEVK